MFLAREMLWNREVVIINLQIVQRNEILPDIFIPQQAQRLDLGAVFKLENRGFLEGEHRALLEDM